MSAIRCPIVTRPLHRLIRAARGRPGYLVRFNHPVSETAWDFEKGLRGWVASDDPVEAVLVRGPGFVEPGVALERREDVEWHLGGQFKHQIGFFSRRPLRAWFGGQSAVDLVVEVRWAGGRAAEVPCAVRFDAAARRARYARIRPSLRCPACGGELADRPDALACAACGAVYSVVGDVPNFLTQIIASEFGIESTDNISSWGYDERIEAMLRDHPGGLFLDCGAGLRHTLHPNVVNYEIVPYSSTDVVGVGEKLPFADATFDGVLSVAVLEHVRDPFRCAAELTRVLKPGGELFAAVPFLQPLHGYPHHYYNMTRDGLRNLFAGLEVVDQSVPLSCHPIESLRWFLMSYELGLPPDVRRRFSRMRVRDFMALPRGDALARRREPIVDALSTNARFEIASATCLTARKPR